MILIHVTCYMHTLGRLSSINIKSYPANNEEADLKKDIKPLSCHDCVRYSRGCQVPSAKCQPRCGLKVPVSDPGEGKYWRLQHRSTAALQHRTRTPGCVTLQCCTPHTSQPTTSASSAQCNVLPIQYVPVLFCVRPE